MKNFCLFILFLLPSFFVHINAQGSYFSKKVRNAFSELHPIQTSLVTTIAISFENGDVRPLAANTDLSSGGALPYFWEEYSSTSGSWSPRAESPQLEKPTRLLIDKAGITGGDLASNTYQDIIILSGGELILQSSATPLQDFIAAGKKLEIQSGGKIIVNGQIKLNSTSVLAIQNNGTLELNSPYLTAVHPFWNGLENFESGSFVIIKNWKWSAEESQRSLFDASTTDSQISGNSNGYKFGNLIISATVSHHHWTLLPGNSFADFKFCENNLEITNTSSSYFITGTSATDSGFEIGGDLLIHDGWFNFGTRFSGGAQLNNYTINGNFINESDDWFYPHYNDSGSEIGHSGNIRIKGNIKMGTMVTENNHGSKKMVLETGTNNLPRYIDIATNLLQTEIEIENGYRVMKKNLSLGTKSTLRVKTGATLDFGFDAQDNPLNVVRNGTQSLMNFISESGSILKITSPQGIAEGGTYTGNVQVGTSGNRIFSPGTIYHYIGKANQETGSGLPKGITGKVIVDLQTADNAGENLSFRSTATTSFATSGGINGLLEIRRGKVIDEPGNGFRNYSGTTDENNDGEAELQKGNLTMSGGRYVISGGGTKPSLSGNYSLLGGTIEFAGIGNTKIRVKPAYYNVDISGINVTSGGKGLVVNNQVKVIAANAKLTIPTSADHVSPYILNAKKGVQVAQGGTLIFEHNAQLMQDEDAINSGEIVMLRKVIPRRIGLDGSYHAEEYNFFSSPVAGQNMKELFGAAANTAYVLVLDEPNNKFVNANLSHYTTKAKGFAIKEPSSDFVGNASVVLATFKGVPNNAANMINISKSGEKRGWNLIGNPYPSNIDLKQLYINNSSIIASEFRFWDNTVNATYSYDGYYGQYSYAIYNALSSPSGEGIPAPGLDNGTEESAKYPSRYIGTGQGFIVNSLNESGGVIFDNMVRRTQSPGALFFGKNFSESDTDRYRLRLKTPRGVVLYQTVVYFDLGEYEITMADTKHPALSSSDLFYSITDDEKLLINSRGAFIQADKISLGIKTYESGLHEIRMETPGGIFVDGQQIYLKDHLLGTTTDITRDGYAFFMENGSFDQRFDILYEPQAILATHSVSPTELTIYQDQEFFLIKSLKEILKGIEFYDVSGRLLVSLVTNGPEVRLNAAAYPSGIYFIRVKLANGKEHMRKIRK